MLFRGELAELGDLELEQMERTLRPPCETKPFGLLFSSPKGSNGHPKREVITNLFSKEYFI